MDRYSFNAIVSDEDAAEVYLPAFQSCVTKGRASATMCSYNAVNGVPSCANSFLMNEIFRGEWQFDGCVICSRPRAGDKAGEPRRAPICRCAA